VGDLILPASKIEWFDFFDGSPAWGIFEEGEEALVLVADQDIPGGYRVFIAYRMSKDEIAEYRSRKKHPEKIRCMIHGYYNSTFQSAE
jgi:hypothetical protein